MATYLLIEGYTLMDIDYSNPRYEFYFKNDGGILDKSQKYMTGNALVDPAVYQRINRRLSRVIKEKGLWR